MKKKSLISTLKYFLKKRDSLLAPYAQKNSCTEGREYPEKEHPMRTPFQRDRDRVVHSRAFRRLEYKTQVFINHEGDHYRTRLTHTIEVSTISRTIAKALRLNEDLAEAIALAHDVGHPPFGHAGEAVLNRLMEDEGGFEHNLQSLRIVEKLEKKYPYFNGLNLTWEVREGIIKHRSSFDQPSFMQKYDVSHSPCLEAQVVDFADEIAYTSHDLDDGILSGLISGNQLRDIPIWSEACRSFKKSDKRYDKEVKRYYTVRNVIDLLVSDLILQSYKNILASSVKSVADVKNQPAFLIRFSSKIEEGNKILKDFLMKNLYQHEKVVNVNSKAGRVLEDVFQYYLKSPKKLKESTKKKTKERSLKRVICDYIAGMTDRYVIYLHHQLYPSRKKELFERYI
ncbi:MAG: deoxyguanosinetriphosphate triphosphohydrolase [Candidatus Aureabacteria bacterium]|nr:deoxyguanosinetriphosphate triphosphohydrolase [Candidatus Auribacterota bacterium]